MSVFDLLLPIGLSTLLLWFASAIIHMVVKYHNSDYQKLSNEDEVAAAVERGNPSLGLHSYPHCTDMKEMQSEAMKAKMANSVGMVIVLPKGMPNMGKLLGQQILAFLLGSLLVAYCATLALAPGAPYLEVYRFVMTVGFLTFGWGGIPYSIWFGMQWSMTFKYMLDALIYGALMAGVFAWLWPGAGG